MEEATRENTIILMAASGGYFFDGFSSEGYKVYTIYKPTNIVQRIIREVCFRLPILPKVAWYNKGVLNSNPQFIIVTDALVTREYLNWLLYNFPRAKISFMYNNMVGNARHLKPSEIPNRVSVWTYDGYDSEKFHIALRQTSPYFPYFIQEKKEIKYDLFFVGRDKGRGEKILRFQKWLDNNNLRTYFIITKDGKFKKNKSFYSKEISYDENVKIVSQSRAVLNVVMKNQRGITLRDLECLFNKVKLVTTNKYIKSADFYNRKNIFIIGEDDLEKLPEFIKSDYDDSMPMNMDLHSAEAMVKEVTGTWEKR